MGVSMILHFLLVLVLNHPSDGIICNYDREMYIKETKGMLECDLESKTVNTQSEFRIYF